jgi:Arc/MetJ family transcription regulator
MATNLEIDSDLFAKAMRLGGQRTKRSVVIEALEEYIQRREQARILELFGQVDYDPDYDPKAQRKRK